MSASIYLFRENFDEKKQICPVVKGCQNQKALVKKERKKNSKIFKTEFQIPRTPTPTPMPKQAAPLTAQILKKNKTFPKRTKIKI
jgi:hypothetical protein